MSKRICLPRCFKNIMMQNESLMYAVGFLSTKPDHLFLRCQYLLALPQDHFAINMLTFLFSCIQQSSQASRNKTFLQHIVQCSTRLESHRFLRQLNERESHILTLKSKAKAWICIHVQPVTKPVDVIWRWESVLLHTCLCTRS